MAGLIYLSENSPMQIIEKIEKHQCKTCLISCKSKKGVQNLYEKFFRNQYQITILNNKNKSLPLEIPVHFFLSIKEFIPQS